MTARSVDDEPCVLAGFGAFGLVAFHCAHFEGVVARLVIEIVGVGG